MNKELLWDLATRVMTRVRCLSCVRIYRAHLDTFFYDRLQSVLIKGGFDRFCREAL
jgi:hypothetical protein